MSRRWLLPSLLVCLLVSPAAFANNTGKTGASVSGCSGCHTGGSGTTTALLTPASTSVNTGTTIAVTLKVTNTAMSYGGLDVSASGGTLSAGSNTRLATSEITHSAKQAMTSGSVTFNFNWTAPSTAGTYTLYAAGNAVNGNALSSGDKATTTSTTITVVSCPDADGDTYTTCAGDCDDTKATVNPGATELCDASNTDEDCDGLADDADTSVSSATRSTWFLDADADSYGLSTSTATTCDKPTGYAAVAGDCNDSKAAINPGATEVCDASNIDEDCDSLADDADSSVSSSGKSTFFLDGDSDTYGGSTATTACDKPTGYATVGGDCDDARGAINPGATEVCDASNTDEDCDSVADDADTSVSAATLSTFYPDVDGDTYGATAGVGRCDQPTGYVTRSGDCDDSRAAISPLAAEVCDSANTDEDCDALADDSDPSVSAATRTAWYTDLDGDGYGLSSSVQSLCDAPARTVSLAGDCDDADTAYNPGASEVCTDREDYNCDGSIGFVDLDGDTFAACEDCDDSDPDINADALEACDGVDNNCDGFVDEDSAIDALSWYQDSDADGYGDSVTALVACEAPPGYVGLDGDCDDNDLAFHPGAAETCDDPTDYDCDGSVAYVDADGDGWAACADCDDASAAASPDEAELCDGIDNNCDGVIDEAAATDATTWYVDADGDSFGDSAFTLVACSAPTGYVATPGDCDDANNTYFPGAPESCTVNADNNCDGSVLYADADGDLTPACEDCDDSDAAAHPGGAEVCDGADNDCDGTADLGAADATSWYLDEDGDGHGTEAEVVTACAQPEGYAALADDCDDSSADALPGGEERCGDGLDGDCDGEVDPAELCDSSDTGPIDTDGGGGDDGGTAENGGDAPKGNGKGCATTSSPWGLGAALLAGLGLLRRRRA